MVCISTGTIYPMFIIHFNFVSHNCNDNEIYVKTYVNLIIFADEDKLWSGLVGFTVVG